MSGECNICGVNGCVEANHEVHAWSEVCNCFPDHCTCDDPKHCTHVKDYECWCSPEVQTLDCGTKIIVHRESN